MRTARKLAVGTILAAALLTAGIATAAGPSAGPDADRSWPAALYALVERALDRFVATYPASPPSPPQPVTGEGESDAGHSIDPDG